jgi:hypothetical protein
MSEKNVGGDKASDPYGVAELRAIKRAEYKRFQKLLAERKPNHPDWPTNEEWALLREGTLLH